MTARTVVGTVVLPGGVVPTHATVMVELVASTTGRAIGWVPTADLGIAGRRVLECDTNGAWTVDLRPNTLISPSGTYYRLTYTAASDTQWSTTFTIVVPDSAGPHRVEDILAVAPTDIAYARVLQTGLLYADDPFVGQVGPPIPNMLGGAVSLNSWRALAAMAPTGASLIITVALDGTTVATVTIAAGQTSGTATTAVAWPSGGVLTATVTQVGSTLPGERVSLHAAGTY